MRHLNIIFICTIKDSPNKKACGEWRISTQKFNFSVILPTFPTPKLGNSIYGTYHLKGL